MTNNISEKDNLNLPHDPDFKSPPPVYTLAEMIKICEAMLPFWNKQKLEKPDKPKIDLGPFKL